MYAAAKNDTVWIGFIDIVPVIGTVKESVELVLALYEGNKEVVKEKEKAIKNIVKEPLKAKDVNKVTDKPAAAAAVDAFSGLKNVTEVSKVKIIEHVNKGSKRGTKPLTEAEKKDRQKKVETINREMLEKIRIINPDFGEELTEELRRSQRGEHVFNNNILRFHHRVLTDFIQNHHIDNLRGYNQQEIDRLARHTLPNDTETDIQDNMVVHFEDNEFYINANAVLYGHYCRALREALLNVLNNINPADVTPAQRLRVNFIIDNMNNLEVYVDQLARARWIGNSGARLDRFRQVKQEVAHMYNTDRGFDWCIQILNVVAPLFGYTLDIHCFSFHSFIIIFTIIICNHFIIYSYSHN